jgi:hypothetical protein
MGKTIRFFSIIGGLVMALGLVSMSIAPQGAQAADAFDSGTGEVDEPYVIADCGQLQLMASSTLVSANKYFILSNNIDCSSTPDWNGNTGFVPIGTMFASFTGNFDGKNYVISGLYISTTSFDVGLFGYAENSDIKNVGLEDVEIKGGSNVGGLVGSGDTLSISNSYVSGSIIGDSYVGGLVGYGVALSISNSYSLGEINGDFLVGGLVGNGVNSIISNSYASGLVMGDTFVGGLVGSAENSEIFESYSWANVEGIDSLIGGFIGINEYSTTTDSYSIGNVTGTNSVGGFIGENNGTIIRSYSIGYVTGTGSDIGGLIGTSTGIVTDSFWDIETSEQATSEGGTGTTTAKMKLISTFSDWGNIGYNDTNDMNDGYPFLAWEVASETPAWHINPGAPDAPTNLTAEAVSTTEINLSWDAPTDDGGREIEGYQIEYSTSVSPYEWNIASTTEVTTTFSHLDLDPGTLYYYQVSVFNELGTSSPSTTSSATTLVFTDGDGSPSDPYQITNWTELNAVRNYSDVYFILNNDLSSTTDGYTTYASSLANGGAGWEPIGSSIGNFFTGNFDGAGFVISDLYINRTSTEYIGLFKYVSGTDTVIKNIGLENFNIIGKNIVGSLAGYVDYSTISNSYSIGGVSTNDISFSGNYVGGLVGILNRGDIINSYSKTNVFGRISVGGFVGESRSGSFIENSYALGNVTGTVNVVGGFIGNNDGVVSSSYSIGYVTGTGLWVGGFIGTSTGIVTNSFWDIETSEQADSAGGTGMTTAEMNRRSTFSGWDIGYNDDAYNDGYPFLAWEVASDTPAWHINPGAPDAPTNLTAEAVSTTEINLTWEAPADDGGREITGYQIEYSTSSPSYDWNIASTTEVTTTFSHLELDPSTLYYYQVSAINELGTSSPSVVTSTSTFSDGVFAGGEGTSGDPYQIATWEQLDAVRDYLDSYFILNNDLSSTTGDYDDYASSTANGDLGWEPIGSIADPFIGNFDGNGLVISDLNINRSSTDYVGLFGHVSGTGMGVVIKDIGLRDVEIIGQNLVGGLVGSNWYRTITNSHVTGNVTGGNKLIGGILIGGIVGDNFFGTVTNSFFTGSVFGINYVGGLVGSNWGVVTSSYSIGDVTGVTSTGGLVGNNAGDITESYTGVDVTGSDSIGGLVGSNTGNVTDSYARGNVTGTNSVGGFIGYNDLGVITYSYSIGYVTGTGSDIGGLIGTSTGTVTDSFWDTETSEQADSAGGTGTTTAEMKLISTFSGWDIGYNDDAYNDGYPFLSWEVASETHAWHINPSVPDPVSITYSGSFTEDIANDGSVTGSIIATLTGDTFEAPIELENEVTVTNVPAGLTAVVTRNSSTTVTITLTGNAIDHADADDIDDLTITFLDGAFTNTASSTEVAGYQNALGSIDFINASITYTGSFTEATANDGSVTGSITAALTGDTFVNPISLGTHVTVSNTPAGLTAVATRTSPTVVTITLTGKATSHTAANSISNLRIAFLDGAFTNTASSTDVTGNNKTNGTITFNNAASSGGGGGGGGVIIASGMACSSVTYGEWSLCLNNTQYRNVLSQTPSGCTLNAAQEASRTRTCGITATTTPIVTPIITTVVTPITPSVSDVDVDKIMDQERSLTTTINRNLIDRLRGRILLQVEEKGQAWYIHPLTGRRHYLGRPIDAFRIMREQGIGITNSDLLKISISLDYLKGTDSDSDGLSDDFEAAIGTDKNKPDTDGDGFNDHREIDNNYDPLGPGALPIDKAFSRLHAGKIFLQVQRNGEAWYINPLNEMRYFLGRPTDAFNIMRGVALGISNADIRQIPVGE